MAYTRIRTGVSIISKRNQILLVPHHVDGEILWYLPGGGVEFLERIEDAAIREFKEETGFDIELKNEPQVIQFVRQNPPWHSITFLYRGTIIGGVLQAEASQWGTKMPVWFSKSDLSQIKIVSYLQDAIAKQIS